jgi:hypothetical protein
MRQSGEAETDDRTHHPDWLTVGPEGSSKAIRAELARRLRARHDEIERTVVARALRLAGPVAIDSVLTPGSHRVIAAVLCYSIEGIEKGVDWPLLIPPVTARHARHAAREGVSLDLVLRRYMAGYSALEEFVVAEAEGIPSQVLCQILSDQAPRVDRLLEFVAGEYKVEEQQRRRSPSQMKADQIERLLQSDGPAGQIDLDYDLDAWHIGLIVKGAKADLVARTCAERLGYRLLYAIHDSETVWAWLSNSCPPDVAKVEACLIRDMPPEVSAAIGEPRPGLDGWRLGHREAQMAAQMMQNGQRFVRAREVVLHAAVMRDDTILRTLVDSYLGPLKTDRSAQKLLDALRAYLASGGNAAAAAAALGVKRHTVHRRIRRVEETLGRPLHSCVAELLIALKIDELDLVSGL